MNVIETFIQSYEFNRGRTLGLLEQALEAGDGVLTWRPGDGRAHIAWQLAHIGITEDIFASERLGHGKQGRHPEVWARFRGGSSPSDEPLSADQLRMWLKAGRENLLETLTGYDESRLDDVVWMRPQTNEPLNLLTVLNILGWHEAHHQGQAHITLNLFKAAR